MHGPMVGGTGCIRFRTLRSSLITMVVTFMVPTEFSTALNTGISVENQGNFSLVVDSNNVLRSTPGSYTVTYTVGDGINSVEDSRTVVVEASVTTWINPPLSVSHSGGDVSGLRAPSIVAYVVGSLLLLFLVGAYIQYRSGRGKGSGL